jgi:hypothetical protein
LADRAGLEVELPGAQSAPLTARRALRRWCGARVDDDELLIDAELLVSELTTNALAHGQGSSRCVRAWTTIACSSRSSMTARGLSATWGARTSGRSAVGGLGIVDDLASRWGVREGTTHVWFELERARLWLAEPDG